jgi:hypothetical protein
MFRIANISKTAEAKTFAPRVGVFETIKIVDFLSTLTRTTRDEDFIRTLVQTGIFRVQMLCFVRTRRRTAKYIYRLINRF